MKYHSPIMPWLNRKRQLPDFSFQEFGSPDFSLGGFLALDVSYPLHEVVKHPAKSLKQTWNDVREYVQTALEIVGLDYAGWIDRDEVDMIKESLGEPPIHSYPIYLVTVGEGSNERVVYVGKTSSNTNRFLGGHRVALKLHHPDYNNVKKTVYFGCVVFLLNKEYLPIEWISPISDAESILDSVESEIIYRLQPELNTQKKDRNYSKHDISLQFENFTDSNYLHGEFFHN